MEDKDKPQTWEEFTAWDRFATAALQGWLARNDGHVWADKTAEDAAKLADAMLLEQRRRYSDV